MVVQGNLEVRGTACTFQDLGDHAVSSQKECAAKGGDVAGEIDGEIHFEDGENVLVFKTYKEVKPHYSKGSKEEVVQGYIYNYDNDEYVYYFLIEREPTRNRVWWGMGLGGQEVDGVYLSILFLLLNFIFQYASGGVGERPGLSRGIETQEYKEWTVEGINERKTLTS